MIFDIKAGKRTLIQSRWQREKGIWQAKMSLYTVIFSSKFSDVYLFYDQK